VPDINRLKERARQRWRVVDLVLAVVERTGSISGGAFASQIALVGFLSLFPLLLVGIAVTGFIAAGDSTFPRDLIRQLGLDGEAARSMLDALTTAEKARGAATIVGLVGLLWSGLGVVGALSGAIDKAWQVTGRGLVDKARGLLWLIGAFALFMTSIAVTSLAQWLPWFLAPVSIAVAFALSVVLFTWTFSTLGAAHVGWREHLPGSILMAAGSEVLKLLGTVWLPRTVGHSSAVYGAVGIVFALLAWFALYGRLFVYAAVLNVVLHERRFGTVTVQVEAPRIPGEVPLEADRGGSVVERQPIDA
jgi:membrane protein